MKLLSSKTIYKGLIFRLDKDVIIINNRKITREIIHHPGSALMLPLLDINNQTIILIEQYRYATGGNLLEFPAGTIDKPESAKKCAARELIEETGYKAKSLKEITKFFLAPGTMTEVMHMFLCTKLIKKSQNLMPDEIIKPHITSLNKAISMVFNGKISDAKTIAGLMVLNEIFKDKKLKNKFLI
ncbi:MAG: NUDIX hydrolase [bacterium]